MINPWSYYSNTRWSNNNVVWHGETGLYLSAVRFGGRVLLEWTGLHRLSSLFLEPVSLGNWCIIITIFVSAFWQTLSFKTRLYFILSNVILLVGSDSRLALPTAVLIAGMSLFVHKLPRYIYISYLPGVVAIAAAFVFILGNHIDYDDYPGRIVRSVNVLISLDLPALLGIDHSLIEESSDSGISYFILTQSIIGVVALWLFICLLQPPTSRRAAVFMHGLCVYLALGLSISYSVFTIKTAAPIWFLYGYIAARGYLDNRITRYRGVEPSIHGSAIHSGIHRSTDVEAPVAGQ